MTSPSIEVTTHSYYHTMQQILGNKGREQQRMQQWREIASATDNVLA